MNMKINDAIQKNLGVGFDKTDPKSARKTDTSSAGQSSASGKVTLSEMSAKLQSLEAKVAAENVYDAEKVEAIKQAISNGQFTVSAEKVADGLINTVKDMLQTRSN